MVKGEIVEGHKVFWQRGSLKEAVADIMPDMLVLAMRGKRYEPIMKDLTWCSEQGIV